MASIGSFGAAVREIDPDGERDTFDFFGEDFTIEGVIPPILTLQLGAAITGNLRDSEGRAAMWLAMQRALTVPERNQDGKTVPADESQFDRFYSLAVENTCGLDELMRLVFTLSGSQTGRPTGQRPTSQAGPLPTSTSSNSPSSDSPGLVSVEDRLAGLS